MDRLHVGGDRQEPGVFEMVRHKALSRLGSPSDASNPRFSRDGRRLYYIAAMRPIVSHRSLTALASHLVPCRSAPIRRPDGETAPDGSFLAVLDSDREGWPDNRVIVNWLRLVE